MLLFLLLMCKYAAAQLCVMHSHLCTPFDIIHLYLFSENNTQCKKGYTNCYTFFYSPNITVLADWV